MDNRWRKRRAAVRALVAEGDEGAKDRLSQVLRNPDEHPRVRAEAAAGLGALDVKQATPELIRVLRDREDDSRVREEAARALGAMKENRATADLIEVLRGAWEEGNEDPATAAAWALGEIADPIAIEPLTEVVRDRRCDEFFDLVHREAMFALYDLGCIDIVREIAADQSRYKDLLEDADLLLAKAKPG